MTEAPRAAPAPVVVDWWLVITELQRAGWSHERVAGACECDRSTITKIANDHEYGAPRDPQYRLGVRILALWMDVLDRTAKDIPCGHSPRRRMSIGA